MFQKKKVVGKIKTHISLINNFFKKRNRTVYEIMWKNMLEPDRPQVIIWSMRIA